MPWGLFLSLYKVLILFFVSDPKVRLRQKTQLKTYSRQRQGLAPRGLFPICEVLILFFVNDSEVRLRQKS